MNNPTPPRSEEELRELFDERYCGACDTYNSIKVKNCFNCGREFPNRVFTKDELEHLISTHTEAMGYSSPAWVVAEQDVNETKRHKILETISNLYISREAVAKKAVENFSNATELKRFLKELGIK